MSRLARQWERLGQAYRVARKLPRGLDQCVDLAPLVSFATILDVGANVGQSAARYLARFPRAQVHCFEPSAANAAAIRQRLGDRVRVHQVALGSTAGTAMLAHGAGSDTHRIGADGDEAVAVATLDDFCTAHGIARVDFLKIDTEGHDLEVLKGADALLRTGAVAAVQVEAGMNPENRLHVPFEVLKHHLEERDYRLFGIYEQAPERPTRQPHLRRSNPVFVHLALL